MVEPTPPTQHATPQTFINPIAWFFNALAWIQAHFVLVLVLAAIAVVLVLLIWLLGHIRIIRGRKLAVKNAVKAAIKDAEESGSKARYLVTRGNARTPSVTWGRVSGVKRHSSLVFVALYPRKGAFKRAKKRLVLLAPHHVADLNGSVLEVDALGISRHGLLSWPDEDLASETVRVSWAALLGQSTSAPEPLVAIAGAPRFGPESSAYLLSEIYDWFLRAFTVEVAAQQLVRGLDIMFDNVASSMSENLLRKNRAGIEGLFEMTNGDEDAPPSVAKTNPQEAESHAR